VAEWREKDPIRRFALHLKERRLLTESLEDQAAAAARKAVRMAVEAAEAAPPVPSESLFEGVYAEMPWHLAEQRDELLAGRG
jgi:TPP-dependent pyruvate/acetoin dehydrogenase alpha subunit